MGEDQAGVLAEPDVGGAQEDLRRHQAADGDERAARRPLADRDGDEREHRERGQVHEEAVDELDVDEAVDAERHELVDAARELLAAGRMGAQDGLGGRALALGARDQSAGHDRRQDEHGRYDGERAQEPAAARGLRLGRRGKAPEREERAEEDHREAEVRGHEVLVKAFLDGEAAKARLSEDEHARGGREADDPAVLAKAPPGAPGDHQHQDGDDARGDAVGVLDHGLGRRGGDHAALAERPSVRA